LRNRIRPESMIAIAIAIAIAEEVSVCVTRYRMRVAGRMSERGWRAFPEMRVVSWHEAARRVAASCGSISPAWAGPS
jgi:hypothetical protein